MFDNLLAMLCHYIIEELTVIMLYWKVWDFETIDTADSTDDSGVFEMEPMNEIKIGQGHEHVSLRSIVKSLDEIDGEPSTFWYAQVRATTCERSFVKKKAWISTIIFCGMCSCGYIREMADSTNYWFGLLFLERRNNIKRCFFKIRFSHAITWYQNMTNNLNRIYPLSSPACYFPWHINHRMLMGESGSSTCRSVTPLQHQRDLCITMLEL